ncbi:MAG TPA: DUF5996 family protein [Gemmataceae bacterium]|jgi:hypothetical protein|nr:DUF5996 family protein [Gemmataceae bacterium]
MTVDVWPDLPVAAWKDAYATLHLWTQVVGKVRLAKAPMVNHWWQVPLYVTARGLTTSPMPDGSRTFQIDFDFHDHTLQIATSDGGHQQLALKPQSVAAFYAEVMAALRSLGLDVHIWSTPCEIADPIPFEKDQQHATYDRDAAHTCWRLLVSADRVLQAFRGRFLGKCSPVHFFWGSFDLAVTRFSGRTAPRHPGAPNIADHVTREAYSHEVSSAGFWPGGGPIAEPVFYAYAYAEPAGFASFPVRPAGAYYHPDLREFLFPLSAIRQAADPDTAILDFLQSTYEAAAELGKWDRVTLERPAIPPAI